MTTYTIADRERLEREIVDFVQYESYGDRAVRRDLRELERQLAIVNNALAAQNSFVGRLRTTYARYRRY